MSKNKCFKCDILIAGNNYAICVDCKNCFHFDCSTVETSYKKINKNRPTWKCTECVTITRSRSNSCRDVDNDLQEIKQSITEFKNEMQSLPTSFAELSASFAELLKTITFLSAQYDDLKMQVDKQEIIIKDHKTSIGKLEEVIKQKDDIITNLTERMNETEQYSRANNVEVFGIPEVRNEDCKSLIVDVASELNVNVTTDDISVAHRLPKREGIPSIVVQFISRDKKNAFLKNRSLAITNNNIKGTKIGSKIFINDHLTVYNKSLLTQTKNIARDKNIQYVWFKNGKILARKNSDSNVIRIKNEMDLNKL